MRLILSNETHFKYLHMKVACCPWNHTMWQRRSTYRMTAPLSCAVSHVTLTQSSFIPLFIPLFMFIFAHSHWSFPPNQTMILWLEILIVYKVYMCIILLIMKFNTFLSIFYIKLPPRNVLQMQWKSLQCILRKYSSFLDIRRYNFQRF